MMFILVLYLIVEDNGGLSVWLYEKNLNSNTKTFVEENLRAKLVTKRKKKNIANKKKVVIFNLGECICLCCVNINMPISKMTRPQLNNRALHISCYTTNVEHRLIQLHLRWFCLGARIVFSPSGYFQLFTSDVLYFSSAAFLTGRGLEICEQRRRDRSEQWVFREVSGLCFCFYMCFSVPPSGVVVEPGRTLPTRRI